MTRTLVLTDEAARHSFRRSLPPSPDAPAQPRGDDGDWKLFLLSFLAFFTCFCTMIF